jgi:hypothetical protein
VDQREFLCLVARFFAFAFFFVVAFFATCFFFVGLRGFATAGLRLGVWRPAGAPRVSPPMKEGGSLAGKLSSICASILPFRLVPGAMGVVPELHTNASSYAGAP